MAKILNAIATRFNDLVEWFLPPTTGDNRDLVKHMRMYIITHILGPFLGNSVPAALYLFDPAPGANVAILAVAITSFWVTPFILRMNAQAYYPLAVVSLQNLMFCVLWSCFFYGGITSPTLPWVLVIPLHIIFYVGSARRLRLAMLAMFTANLAAFYGLSATYGLPAHNMPFASLQGLGLISTAAASLYTAMMAFFYAKVAASHSELEKEMRQHLETATQLRKATDEAERAGAAKADFLAKMSHELRTPLNAVIGYSQLLLEDADDDELVETIEDLHKIHNAGAHLLKLVNEVLDLIKIQSGKMDIYREQFPLDGLIQEIVAELADSSNANETIVSTEIADSLPHLFTDRAKLRDAIFELAENAIKFTKKGAVKISAEQEKDGLGTDRDALVIRVEDNGIGISVANLTNIFEQFNDLSDASSSKYGGTGLGLALARSICNLLGGDVSVSSTEHVGSKFTIRVPFAAPEPACDDVDNLAGENSEDLPEVDAAVSKLKVFLDRHAHQSPPAIKAQANG